LSRVRPACNAAARAAGSRTGLHGTFALTGPEEFTFRQLLDLELGALGKRKPIVPVPLPLMNLAVPLMQVLPKPPITRDQYAMLKEGNTAPNEPARSTFDLPMLRRTAGFPAFAEGWALYSEQVALEMGMYEGDPRLIANELDVTLDVLEDYEALVVGVAD